MPEFNAMCPKCEKLIFLDLSEEALPCPACGKSIYVPRAVMMFEEAFSSKGDDSYKAPKTVAPPTREGIILETVSNMLSSELGAMSGGIGAKKKEEVGSVEEHPDEKREIVETPLGKLTARVGACVTLGTYEQWEKNQPIEWLVLAVENGKALLITKYGLVSKKYNRRVGATWENSSIRTWLNNEFLNTAFTDSEKRRLLNVKVTADKNPSYSSTNPGKATKDQVFLLSIAETREYLASEASKKCELTPYAKANVSSKNDRNACSWWLRTPGFTVDYAAYVHSDGEVQVFGSSVSDEGYAVRPAVWVKI